MTDLLAGNPPSVSTLYAIPDDQSIDLLQTDLHPLLASIAASIQASSGADLTEIGLLLSVAGDLCLAKSRAMLPSLPREQAVERERLAAIDPLEYESVADRLREVQGRPAYAGPNRLGTIEPVLEPRSAAMLGRAWRELQKRSAATSARVVPPSFVRLEVALSRLIRRLGSSRRLTLSTVLRGATRQDAVVHFLAVLEMLRRRQVAAVQLDLFGDIALEVPANDGDQAEHDMRAG